VEFFEEAVDFARKYEMVIVQDAAYAEVYYDDADRPHSILEVDGARDVAIEIHSLSKTFNMTGWRVAWAWGGAEHVEALSRAKSNVDSGTFMAIQRAAAAGLDNYEDFAPQMQAAYKRRRDALVEGLQSLGCPIEAPRATFYVWIPVPAGYDSEGFAKKLLGDCRVLAIPGAVYGAAGEGFVRMSLTIKGDDKIGQIEEAIENMKEGGVAW